MVEFTGKNKIYTLTKPIVTIGRGNDNDIVVNYTQGMKYVSTYHAKLSIVCSDLLIQDVGSTNGTFITRGELTFRRLQNNVDYILQCGDILLLGSDKIKFEVIIVYNEEKEGLCYELKSLNVFV